METKTCRACRTVNEGFAIVCRNCGARIGELPQPGADQSAAGPGGGADQGSQPTTQAPPPVPAMPVAGSDAGFGPPPPPGVTPTDTYTHPGVLPKRSRNGLLLAIVAGVVVLGAVGVFALTRGGGGGLPAELAGHPRSDSELAQRMEDLFQGFAVGGMSIDFALYGEGDQPAAMLMLFDGLPPEVADVPPDVFFDSFAAGFAQQQGLGIDPSAGVRDSSAGAEFLCVDVPAEAFGGGGLGGLGGFGTAQSGSFCVFKGETIGMIMLIDGTGAAAAMPAVQAAYAEIA